MGRSKTRAALGGSGHLRRLRLQHVLRSHGEHGACANGRGEEERTWRKAWQADVRNRGRNGVLEGGFVFEKRT